MEYWVGIPLLDIPKKKGMYVLPPISFASHPDASLYTIFMVIIVCSHLNILLNYQVTIYYKKKLMNIPFGYKESVLSTLNRQGGD